MHLNDTSHRKRPWLTRPLCLQCLISTRSSMAYRRLKDKPRRGKRKRGQAGGWHFCCWCPTIHCSYGAFVIGFQYWNHQEGHWTRLLQQGVSHWPPCVRPPGRLQGLFHKVLELRRKHAKWGCVGPKSQCRCTLFPLRFKNLVRQYQSMYPALKVDAEDQLKKLKVGQR